MGDLLAQNPLFLLFIVAAVGYVVGQIKIKGSTLGVSAVLFVGLAFGAMNDQYNVPDIIFQLGIVIFVYSIGLSSGPAFFASFGKNGMKNIGFILVMLTVYLFLAAGLYFLLDFSPATTTGIYAGSTTNTPAMAAVIEVITQKGGAEMAQKIQSIVVGYTYSYPMGIIGVMVVLKIMERIFKVDYEKEKEDLSKTYPIEENLTSMAVKITNPELNGVTLRDVVKHSNWNVNFGRIYTDDGEQLTNWDTQLKLGHTVLVIGSKKNLESICDYMGVKVGRYKMFEQNKFDVNRIFVSNPNVAGKTLAELNIQENYSAVITRIRRGDVDMLAKSDTVLEIGDRIRFVARREDLKALSDYFGDSYDGVSTINLFSFGLGIAIGIVLGLIEVTLPGGVNFKLGLSGGPLVAGLIFGALRRTGPVLWTLPYSSNVTLRQIGLIMLLAAIGLRSGNSFLESLSGSSGWLTFLGSTLLTTIGATLSLIIGYKFFKIPFSLLLGFMSSQPAILDFGLEMSKNRVPLIGYSIIYPISLVMKVLYAQLLYLLL